MEMNKVILVTGSSRGIGAGLVANFVKKGYRAVINYSTSAEEAGELYNQISDSAGRDNILLIKADVSKRSEVRDMLDRIIDHFGGVDVLINNAGVNLDGPFLEMTDEQWQRVIDTNLTGTFICSQEFALHFKGEVGDIINIGASTAIRGRKNGCNYCSAKAGVITLTKCLALELAPRIRVNCIIPGYIETEEVMTRYNLYDTETLGNMLHSIPVGRLGTTDDIFKAAEFLVENASYITGQNFLVNGGVFMY
jgi:NAD(P)-dependent dehydrogenase (short-subunit alcohol dehydrogenase family)